MSPANEDADVQVRDLTPADAYAVTTWRYDGPWSIYNGNAADALRTEDGYHAIIDRATDTFLGYVCLGIEARVPGLVEEPGVLDVGIGLDPSVVGKGRGRSIALSVLPWIESCCEASELRAVIQAWNQRSLRLCRGLGFEVAGQHQAFQNGSLVDYVVMKRPLNRTGAPL